MQSVKNVSCPRCGKAVPLIPENQWRPFCGERCKMIDLGRWGSEAYRLPEDDKSNSKPPES